MNVWSRKSRFSGDFFPGARSARVFCILVVKMKGVKAEKDLIERFQSVKDPPDTFLFLSLNAKIHTTWKNWCICAANCIFSSIFNPPSPEVGVSRCVPTRPLASKYILFASTHAYSMASFQPLGTQWRLQSFHNKLTENVFISAFGYDGRRRNSGLKN